MKLLSLIFLLAIILFQPSPANAKTCGVFEKRVSEDRCEKFTVPSNAHLTYSGNSWDCNRGFKISDDRTRCEKIRVPGNATANTIGNFNCNSGFKRVGDECAKVPDIDQGKFYEFGADFYCNQGFKRNEETRKCDRIRIPENAFGDSTSLDGWRCFGGYIKEGNECKKFDLPEHAFWSGNFWKCETGYKKISDRKVCEKISIPENAHASDTFDGWLCNSGFTKNYRDNRCEKLTP